jgi:hypothetical protein
MPRHDLVHDRKPDKKVIFNQASAYHRPGLVIVRCTIKKLGELGAFSISAA